MRQKTDLGVLVKMQPKIYICHLLALACLCDLTIHCIECVWHFEYKDLELFSKRNLHGLSCFEDDIKNECGAKWQIQTNEEENCAKKTILSRFICDAWCSCNALYKSDGGFDANIKSTFYRWFWILTSKSWKHYWIHLRIHVYERTDNWEACANFKIYTVLARYQFKHFKTALLSTFWIIWVFEGLK